MKAAALAAEMRQAFAAIGRDEINELTRLGVPRISIDYFQMIGIARIRVEEPLYVPDPHGSPALITPVCTHYPDTAETPRPDVYPFIGNLADLVAWDPRTPESWALRAGAATWLGAIPTQYCGPEPVRVWRSPLNWFRARCEGLVVLTQERLEIFRLLAGCAALLAEDEDHAVELREILDQPFPAPPVDARAREVRYAA